MLSRKKYVALVPTKTARGRFSGSMYIAMIGPAAWASVLLSAMNPPARLPRTGSGSSLSATPARCRYQCSPTSSTLSTPISIRMSASTSSFWFLTQ